MSDLVQSFVNAVGYPEKFSQLSEMVKHHFGESRSILQSTHFDLFFCPPENRDGNLWQVSTPVKGGLLHGWSSPKWILEGDISFFYQSRRSIKHSRRVYNALKKQLHLEDSRRAGTPDSELPLYHQMLIVFVAIAKRGMMFCEEYGSHIFAVGRAAGMPRTETSGAGSHWTNRIYSEYRDVFVLDSPIAYNDFSDSVSLQQRAITPLTASQFEVVRALVASRNPDVNYLTSLRHRDHRISELAKVAGWRGMCGRDRPRFLFESQVREYVFDDFLQDVCSQECEVRREVMSQSETGEMGIIDYLIHCAGRPPLAIEAKLAAIDSPELRGQLRKYCGACTDRGGITMKTHENCLLLDAQTVYAYHPATDQLTRVLEFDGLAEVPIAIIRDSCWEAVGWR